jgi:hypothetical protein
MPRTPRHLTGFVGALLATAALTGALAPAAGARAVEIARTPQPSAAVAEERARQAAERVLKVVQQRDGKAGYALFAPTLQGMTSPTLVGQRMAQLPELQGWTITSVEPGAESSTVLARLQTSRGPRELLIVLDGEGRVEGYHFDTSDQSAERVAREFMQAVIDGRFVSAGSFLSTELQEEIPPAKLQAKWQRLQRITGDYVKIKRISLAENADTMKLVLVTTEFGKVTDNIYVILDDTNTIVGVDFPTEPASGSTGG